jgi:hypothetical protein
MQVHPFDGSSARRDEYFPILISNDEDMLLRIFQHFFHASYGSTI